MLEYIYSLFVWPFQACIEVFFTLFMKITKTNAELSIIISAIIINILLMPFYSAGTSNFSTISYKNYSLSKKIRSLFLITKPYLFIFFYILFFIASYNFFTAIQFENLSFGLISGTTEQNGVLGINLNPVIVLVLSIAAVIVLPFVKNKKLTLPSLIFMGFFLILCVVLYKGPAALSLFWAASAFFLCIKNVIDSMKQPSRWYCGIVLFVCIAFLAFIFIMYFFKRLRPTDCLILLAIDFGIALITIFINSIQRFFESSVFYSADTHALPLYRYSCVVLFFLLGFAIPSLLFSSSPAEFPSVWPTFVHTVCQAASICFAAAFFYWDFSSKIIHRFFISFLPFAIILFLISCFAVPENFGVITSNFVFENWQRSRFIIEAGKSALIILVSGLIVFCLFRFRKFQWLKNGFLVIAASLAVISVINIFSIERQLRLVKELITAEDIDNTNVFTLSKTGENIFVLFLDMAAGFSVPEAFKLNPAIEDSFDGFTWYPNTVTFGNGTITGYPAMIGGYEYRPLELNKRLNETLKDKVNESIKVLPQIFGDAGYKVMVTDPTYSNLSQIPDPGIFDGMKNVQSRNIKGIFHERYDSAQISKDRSFYNEFHYDIMIRFSLFRILPPIVRSVFYDDGNWFKHFGSSSYMELLDVFPNLLYLEDLCHVVSDGSTFNIMMNETTHLQGAHNRNLELVSEPIVFSREELKEFDSSKNSVEYNYTFSAALSAVGNWCEWLKQEGIYDNTKIIVVADHGKARDGNYLHSGTVERRNPLLMVKDFNSRGEMVTSNTFMTNADMPAIAVSSLGRVVNPFTGNEVSSDPKDGDILIVDGPFNPESHEKNTFVINNIWELKNQNIFDSKNWVNLGKPE